MRYSNLYVTTLLFTAMLTGCSKVEVTTPDFEVSTASATYKAGDEVTFHFTGNPENITFYSGEDGARYDSVGKFKVEHAVPQLEFTSATGGGARANSIKLKVAPDFGTPTADNVQTAPWSDLDASFAPTSAASPSGVISLEDVALSSSQPVRFAYKYESATSATLAHTLWSIRSFDLNAIYPDGTKIPITTLTTAGWSVLDVKNPAATWVISSTQLRVDGGARNTPDQEDWIVSAPLNLKITRDVYTNGVSIKSMNNKLSDHVYTFNKPGIYNVTFLASNASVDAQKSVLKQLTITILPK